MFLWLSDTTVSDIYILHYVFYSYDNKNILGEVDDDINFTYDANTEVYYSCSASWNDEMWILGGNYQRRQVSLKNPKFTNCKLL